jgi:hypothetical protein
MEQPATAASLRIIDAEHAILRDASSGPATATSGCSNATYLTIFTIDLYEKTCNFIQNNASKTVQMCRSSQMTKMKNIHWCAILFLLIYLYESYISQSCPLSVRLFFLHALHFTALSLLQIRRYRGVTDTFYN